MFHCTRVDKHYFQCFKAAPYSLVSEFHKSTIGTGSVHLVIVEDFPRSVITFTCINCLMYHGLYEDYGYQASLVKILYQGEWYSLICSHSTSTGLLQRPLCMFNDNNNNNNQDTKALINSPFASAVSKHHTQFQCPGKSQGSLYSVAVQCQRQQINIISHSNTSNSKEHIATW